MCAFGRGAGGWGGSVPDVSVPDKFRASPKHPTAGVPSGWHGKLSASSLLLTTTELDGTPVTLAMQAAKEAEGVLSAVPPHIEMFVCSTWQVAGAGPGAGATGKGVAGGGEARVVGEGVGTTGDAVGVSAGGAGAGA